MAEKNTSTYTINFNTLFFFSGPCVPVQDFALEQVGVQVQILAGLLQFFFHRILHLGVLSQFVIIIALCNTCRNLK